MMNEDVKKLLEIAKQVLGEETLYEFSDSSLDLEKRVRYWTPKIFEHIYKIQMYGALPKYKTTVHHWASEIAGGMAKFCFKKFKSNSKQITQDFIKDAMISKYFDSDEIIDIIYDCCTEYEDISLNDIDIDKAYSDIISILDNLINYCRNTRKMDIDTIAEIVRGF